MPEAARASGTPTGGRPPSGALLRPPAGGSAPPAGGPGAAGTPYTPAAAAGPLGVRFEGFGVPTGLASAPPRLGLPALRAPAPAASPMLPPRPAEALLMRPAASMPAPQPVPAAAVVAAQPLPSAAQPQAQPKTAAAAPAPVQQGAAVTGQQAAPAGSPGAPATLQELLRGPVAADGSPKAPPAAAAAAVPDIAASVAVIGGGGCDASPAVKPLQETAAGGTGRSVPDIAALAGPLSSSDEDAALTMAAQQRQPQLKQGLSSPQPSAGQQRSGASGKSGPASPDCRAAATEPGRARAEGPQQQAAH